MYDETIRAFNLAEKYMVPVILLYDEVVGHMREGVVLTKPEKSLSGKNHPLSRGLPALCRR